MDKETRGNHWSVILGIVSGISIILMLIPDVRQRMECYVKYLVWLYLMVAYLSFLNLLVESVKKSMLLWINLIAQIGVFAVFFGVIQYAELKNVDRLNLVLITTLVLTGIEILTRIKLNQLMLLINSKNNNSLHKISDATFTGFIKNSILEVLGLGTESNAQKTDCHIAFLNSVLFLDIIMFYVLKFVVDIVNFSNTTYSFPMPIIYIYSLLFGVFICISFARGRLLKYSLFKVLSLILGTLFGVYMFVFRQYGNIDMLVLLASVYCLGPVIVDIWVVGRKYIVY